MTLLLSTLIPILCAIFIFGGLGYFLWKNRRRNGYDLPQPESPHFHTYKRYDRKFTMFESLGMTHTSSLEKHERFF